MIADALRPRRLGVALGVVVGLLWSFAKVGIGLLLRGAIDHGIEADDMRALAVWSTAIFLVGSLSAVLTGARRYLAFREARWVEKALRDRLFAHVQRLHFAYHDEVQAGQLMSRGNIDLQHLQNFVVMIPLTIANAMTVLGVTVILVAIDPFLAVASLAALPLINVVAKRFGTRLFPSVMGIQRESAELASVVEESVAGVRVVKGFGAEDVVRGRLRTTADDAYRESMSASRIRSVFLPALELLPNVGLITVLGVGGHRVIDGAISLGSFVAFNFYVVLLIWPLRMLGMIIANGQRASAAAQRVAEVLSTDPGVVDRPDARPLPPGAGEVRFEGVQFSYGDGSIPVLHDFDLTVEAGTSVALVGATGCGKSTVGRLIPRFYDVDGGQVLLDGVDITRWSPHRRARTGLARSFQSLELFDDLTVRENLLAAADPRDRRAYLTDLVRPGRPVLPDVVGTAIEELNLADVIDEVAEDLSYGARRLVAIARAVATQPSVLLLDEPAAGLGEAERAELGTLVRRLADEWGMGVLLIEHDVELVLGCADRVVVLDFGQTIAEGVPAEIRQDAAVRRAYLGEESDVAPEASAR